MFLLYNHNLPFTSKMKNYKILFLLLGFLIILSITRALSGEPLVYPPNISIVFPVNNTNYFTTTLDLNWTSKESLGGLSYSLDGGSNISLVSYFYQEFANMTDDNTQQTSKDEDPPTDTNSSLVDYTGKYNPEDSGTVLTCWWDGNWSTADPSQCASSDLFFGYANYTKPSSASSTSKWMSKVGTGSAMLNKSIPSICWNQNPLQFRLRSSGASGGSNGQSCWNGTDWGGSINGGYNGSDNKNTYEEAMWWFILQNITLTSLTEGKHNITIYGNSSNGNGQSSYVYFTINQTPQWSNNQTNITSNTILNDVGQFNVTLTDNFNLSSSIFSWNVSGFWQNLTQINYTITTINTTLIENRTINQSSGKNKAWTVYFNDSIGNKNQSDIFTFSIKNQLPSVVSATINNSQPIDADNLNCNNGSVSDADSDAITLFYNWSRNGIDIPIKTAFLNNSNTSINDIFICRITPYDGFENGTTKTSASVSVGTGFVAPIINFTNSTPLTAELLKGQWLNLSVNFTDTSENSIDNHTAYFCKTDSANTNGCLGTTFCRSGKNVSANSYLSCRLNITNSSDFPLGATTFYAFAVDNTSLISASKSNTFTIQDITPPILNNWSLQYTNLNDASGNTNQFNVSVTDNVSNIQTITFEINVTLNATKSFSFTQSLSVATNYVLFQSSETLLRGFYNITKVIVTDNSSNSQTYNFTNITFTVSAQPSGGGISGGGGGITPKPIQNITIVAPERCGNFVCEECRDSNISNCIDETPLSCPQDCKLFSLDDTFCTPIFNCGNWLQNWFLNFTLFVVVGGLIYTQYKSDKKKKRL